MRGETEFWVCNMVLLANCSLLVPWRLFIAFEIVCLANLRSMAAEKVNPGIRNARHFLFARHLSQKMERISAKYDRK